VLCLRHGSANQVRIVFSLRHGAANQVRIVLSPRHGAVNQVRIVLSPRHGATNQVRRAQWPGQYPDAWFPFIDTCVIAPCALLAGLGFRVPWTASVLVLDMLYDSAALIWTQTCAKSDRWSHQEPGHPSSLSDG
jgi:hypothetical protein